MRPPRLRPDQLRAIRAFATAAHHPRLFLDADDHDRILAKTQGGLCAQMARRLRAKCDAYTDPAHAQYCDLAAYDKYLAGELDDYDYPQEKIETAIAELPEIG